MASHRGGRRRLEPERPVMGHSVGHGHGHAHGILAHDDEPDVNVERTPRLIVIGTLAAVFIAVLAGLVLLWPSSSAMDKYADALPFGADGVTYPHATVEKVEDCPADDDGTIPCGILTVTVDDGPKVSIEVNTDVADSGLQKGDGVQLLRHGGQDGGEDAYQFYKVDRGGTLLVLAGLFVVVVLAVARLRGLLALVGLGFGALVIGGWLLPSLLSGNSPVVVGLVGSTAILYLVLYLAHGVSMRTSAALLGTLGGLLITAGLGIASVHLTRLSGVADEGSNLLAQTASDMRFQSLLICTIIIAGLGVLNDVTITQASAVWELRAAAPSMTRWELWTSGMRIGRDHIASTIYTIVFAYAGTALLTLLVIQLYDRPVLELASTEQLAQEIVRSLVSSIGLVLAVPLTTALATATVAGPQPVSGKNASRDY